MTRFQMTRRFLTPRVFEGPNLWERAIKGYQMMTKIYFSVYACCQTIRFSEKQKPKDSKAESNEMAQSEKT